MQNSKLQELTDKLYNEGLSKGKQEGEQIIAQAREEAEKIMAQARKNAEAIVAAAEKEAEDVRTKVESDVRMASRESISATKQDIEGLIVAKFADKPVEDALRSADFIKEIIKTVAEKFNAQESTDLSLILPESLKEELVPFVEGSLAKTLGCGIEAKFSKKIAGGFQIGPKDGAYYISLTEDTFKELICAYLRPATKKLLFG